MNAAREILLDVRNLRRYFPIRGGLIQRQVATVQAVDDVTFSSATGCGGEGDE